MTENDSASAGASSGRTAFKIKVLLIDDQAIIGEAVRRMLMEHADIEFHAVTNPVLAVQAAIDLKPTVILQDLVMPMMDGFDLLADFRRNPNTCDIPIVVLSSKEDAQLKAQAFAGGANDYLIKLPDRVELAARIRYHSRSHIHRLERDEAFRFLSESQKRLAEVNLELKQLVALDGLTGIANRRHLDQFLSDEWQRARRSQTELALLFCDVDHFKLYNDTYGHLAGDWCLRKISAVLTENLKRPTDLAARYGGEEFAVVLPETGLEGALAVAEACRGGVEALKLEHSKSKESNVVTISIGIAIAVPSRDLGCESLIAVADNALYRAKHAGRNRVAH